jgi:hypothetical protein
MNYTITLTAAEDAAMSYAAFSQNDWIQNAVHERARIAIEEIVGLMPPKAGRSASMQLTDFLQEGLEHESIGKSCRRCWLTVRGVFLMRSFIPQASGES